MKKLYVPIITPFREDETVNYEALKKITKGLLSEGADGICRDRRTDQYGVCGSGHSF